MKKIVSLMVSIAMITACVSVVSINTYAAGVAADKIVYGDADNNKVVNSDDYFALLDYLASYDPTTGQYSKIVSDGADANGDEKINSDDYFAILDYLASYDPSTGEYSKHLGPETEDEGGSEIILPVVVF